MGVAAANMNGRAAASTQDLLTLVQERPLRRLGWQRLWDENVALALAGDLILDSAHARLRKVWLRLFLENLALQRLP